MTSAEVAINCLDAIFFVGNEVKSKHGGACVCVFVFVFGDLREEMVALHL